MASARDNVKENLQEGFASAKEMIKRNRSWPIENTLYAVVLVLGAVNAVIHIISESVDHDETSDMRSRMLGDGWRLISRRKDISDFEWTFWFSDLREYVIFALFGHIIIALLSSYYVPLFKDILSSIYCIYCVRAALGLPYVLLVTIHSVVFHLTTFSGTKELRWIFALGNILFLHLDSAYLKIVPSLIGGGEVLTPLAYSGLAFTTLRCFSFGEEGRRVDKKKNEFPSFDAYRLLQYIFYLPYFFFGPIMTYDIFMKKNALVPTKADLITLLTEALTTIVGISVIDFLLHFLHISSLANDVEFLQSSPAYVVGFLVFFNVTLDWAKAWVLYRVTYSIAVVVDGCPEAPDGPKCIANLSTFAETYFDRGIQHWLCRYVYDPIGKGHAKIMNEAYAALITFAVVALWQGLGTQVLVWALLNWFGLTFEFILASISPQTAKQNKRIMAFFLGINYWCILLYSIIGISGIESARESAFVMFLNGNLMNIGICLLLSYCYAIFVTWETPGKVKEE